MGHIDWIPIADMPAEFNGEAILFGRGYGYGDTVDEIAKEEPRIWLMSYSYFEGAVRRFASTETYWGSEIYYVDPTLFAEINPPA